MTAYLPLTLPPQHAGIGLRHPHVAEILERLPSVGWLEVHAENYMHEGTAVESLERLRGHYPLSLHVVGLSIGSAEGMDESHLARIAALDSRFRPALVSCHLAWTVADGIYFNDLLPVPYDDEALGVVCRNIQRTQEALKRRILIENLSAYVGFTSSSMEEPEFLAEVVRRTGCGLLLDVNNIHVSAHNLGFDARGYYDALPREAIGEIHLAGHARNETDDGPVLIDDHGSRVADEVWALYAEAIARFGRHPTLVEWDTDIPALDVLIGEAMAADLLAANITKEEPHDRAA